jgi:predicted phosphoribosyltransferase
MMLEGVDDVVAVITPEPFYAVGQMYADFTQVSDADVFEILRRANERRARHRLKPEARAKLR